MPTPENIEKIFELTACTKNTIARYFAGFEVRPSTVFRIERALAAMGELDLARPTIPVTEAAKGDES